jgi:hypothetical protein
MAEVNRKPGNRVVPEAGSLPIIYHFRPTSLEFVGPERHQEWVKLMREHVGVQIPPDWSGDPRETISGSGSGWDDCDSW